MTALTDFERLNAELGIGRQRNAARSKLARSKGPGKQPEIEAEAERNLEVGKAKDAAAQVSRVFGHGTGAADAGDADKGTDGTARAGQKAAPDAGLVNWVRNPSPADDDVSGNEDGPEFPETGEDGFDGPVTAPPKDPIPGVFAAAGEDEASRTERAVADAPAPGTDQTDSGPEQPGCRSRRWLFRTVRRPEGSSPYRIRLPWERRQVILALSILVGLAVLAVGLLGSLDPVGEDSGAPPRPPTLDSTPGGEVQRGSPEYQEVLREANDSGARQALSSQGSFLPTPEALSEPLGEPPGGQAAQVAAGDPFPQAAEATAIWEIAQAGAVDEVAVDEVDPGFESLAPGQSGNAGFLPAEVVQEANPMLPHLSALAERPIPRMGGQAFAPPVPAMPGNARTAPQDPDIGMAAGSDVALMPSIRPGDMARARVLFGLSSDFPGPAIAEIAEGGLAGARVSGDFSVVRSAGGLALSFSTLFLPDGRSMPISAIGLSPWTGGPVTRSRLDPRLFRRFGGLALSGAATGAAVAMAEPATRTSITGGGAVVVDRGSPTDSQILAAGLGRAAGAVQQELAGMLPEGALIELDAGAPIVVLFTSPVSAGVVPVPPGMPAGVVRTSAGEQDADNALLNDAGQLPFPAQLPTLPAGLALPGQ